MKRNYRAEIVKRAAEYTEKCPDCDGEGCTARPGKVWSGDVNEKVKDGDYSKCLTCDGTGILE